MDACLTDTVHAEPVLPTSLPTQPPIARWVPCALFATIAAGLAWRLVRYFSGFPIWGDEAMLLLNTPERDYAGLSQHLRFAQVAPLFFLWLEKTALALFGPSEWSVHLFPFLAGLAAIFVFWRACRAAFSPAIAGFAVAILAVSYYPVRHGAEVKPYAFDLLYAAIYAWLALGHLRNPQAVRWLLGLVSLTPIAVFSSYPSVFVGGAVRLVLAPSICRGTWPQRSLYVVFNLALCGSFLCHYELVAQAQVDAEDAQRTREFLRTYWKDAFPPDALLDYPLWLVKVFTGNMLAYPVGASRGGSTATFLLVMVGSWAMWYSGPRHLLALCWLPFALNFVAAILQKYPFGESARITLHLAPFICILMAHGIVHTLERIRSAKWRARGQLAFYLILFACGSAGIARDLLKPYKTEHDRDVRRLVRDLRQQVDPQEPVFLCHARDEEVLAEFLWYMRTQSWSLDWLSAATIPPSTKSAWLVLCANQEPSSADVMSHLGSRAGEWKAVETDVRLVPPENRELPAMYCRKVHIVRTGY